MNAYDLLPFVILAAVILWLFYWQSRCVISNIMQVTTHQIGYKLFYNKYYTHTVHSIVLSRRCFSGLLYNIAHNFTVELFQPFLQLPIPMALVSDNQHPIYKQNNVCIEAFYGVHTCTSLYI